MGFAKETHFKSVEGKRVYFNFSKGNKMYHQVSNSFKVLLFVGALLTFITTVPAAPCWCPDLTGDDNFVNFADFAKLAENWQQSGTGLAGDFDGSNKVDMNDMAHFAGYWLEEVNCPKYYADELPYMTSFEEYQGYTADPCNLNGQMGWQVQKGYSEIGYSWAYESVPDDYFYYQFAMIDVDSTIVKDFNDIGSNHEYIRFHFIPAIDMKIDIVNDVNVVASVWFNSNGYIYVLDNGTYVNTNVYYGDVYNECWDYFFYSYDYENTWTDITFKMDWSGNTYEVYWDGGTTDIANDANFKSNYDNFTNVRFETTDDWFVLNRLSISSQSNPNLSIDIVSPCACHDDLQLKGRVPIEGTAWGENFGKYDIYICPSDLDMSNFDNWTKIADGYNIVNNGLLGYWDTSLIPNGTYFVGVVLFNDLGYPDGLPDNWLKVVWKTISVGGQVVYEGPGYFPVVGELKGNTFYHEEEPDISVNWQGQFPFELKRSFNNNRKLYNKPFRYGWTHNGQIILQEDTTYRCETEQSGPFTVASWDENLLGMGYIWVKNPDGSARLFRHTTGHDSLNPVIYYPYPNDGSGDYIERYSYDDWGIIYAISYYLVKRDGTKLYFYTEDVDIPAYGPYGAIGWSVKIGINSMTDRFGNSLGFGWNYDKTAVTSISDGRSTIEFDLQDGFYTQARLKVGGSTYRTVNYEWDNTNKIFIVTKTGYGVDANGVYDGGNLKEYETKYQYEESSGGGYNLVGVAYSDDLNKKSIEVDYDGYNRMATRKDYVEVGNYLETGYDYTFYHPDPGNREISYLITEINTPYQIRTILQNEKGNVLEQKTMPFDGSAAIDVNALYEDGANPFKPTSIYEYFDNICRETSNSYNSYGDLTEQKVYIDDVNYIAKEFDYHPTYSLQTRQTSWQDINETGPKVEKISVYGEANGTENQYGKYLVREKQLLAEDPNVWTITNYQYLSNGLVMRETDPNGFVTFYEYNNNNYKKLVKKGTADSNEPVQRFYNDAIGQLRLAANSLGGVILNDYDGFGRLWRIRKYSDPNAMAINDATFIPSRYESMTALSTIIYGYDAKGNRTYEQKEAGGTISTSYMINNQPEKTTYNDGSYVEYSYDARGLKTQERKYDANSTKDYKVTYSYDDMDRPIQTLWYDYDNVNVVKGISSEYYGSGKAKFVQTSGYGNIPEKRTDFVYDILDRLITRTEAAESLNLTTSYSYDAANNRVSVTDPNGNIIYTDYDNANRKIAEYFAVTGGTEPNQTDIKKEIRYHENGQIKDVNSYDYDGDLLVHSEFEYDARGRVTKVTQATDDVNKAVTTYDYNDAGFIHDSDEYHIKMTDAENKETYIALDEFGNRAVTLYPSDDYEELQYNPDGTIAAKAVWDSNDTKRWIEYFYDGYGRLIDANYPDNGNVHYTYDGMGRKRLVKDNRNSTENISGSQQIAYSYDVLDRIVSVTEQDDYETTYAYQADGQKQTVKVYAPNDSLMYHVEYWYDSANRLEYITEPLLGEVLSDWVAKFEYDKNGNRSQLEYYRTGSAMGATTAINYTYNKDNRLTGFVTTGGPTFTLNNTIIDGLGRLIDANETIEAADCQIINHNYDYEYDKLGQLKHYYISNIQPGGFREYNYSHDKAGNMAAYIYTDETGDYNYTCYYDGDMLIGRNSQRCTFDKNGRQTSLMTADPNNYTVRYDGDGKINGTTDVPANGDMTVKYTPDGTRVFKHYNRYSDHYEHKYIYDPVGSVPTLLLVLDANDINKPVLYTYIHANNQVIARFDGNSTSPNKYFYISDRLGSVRQIMNSSGSVVNNYVYSPFGVATGCESTENVPNWYLFCGYYYDDGANSYYCNARNYDYYSCRFFTRDPVKGSYNEPMTLHPYLYCLNDPINKTDPSGNQFIISLPISMGIGAKMRAAELVGAGLAIGYAGALYELSGARAAVMNALIDITAVNWDKNWRPWPTNDPRNPENIIRDLEKRMSGEQPPKDPKDKWWWIFMKLLEFWESFKGD